MPGAAGLSVKEPRQGYQLRVVQEVLLALLADEASHGYQIGRSSSWRSVRWPRS